MADSSLAKVVRLLLGASQDDDSPILSIVNDDRISEVYKGEIWSEAAQQRARRRVHWLCSQAVGDAVLDVGCSQGIASIILGREGYRVTGIDIQPSRIEYALADLEHEAADVQERVRFGVGNGAHLEMKDASVDTVLLGEVIEHLATPARLLREIRRVLKPGGVVAITTPFGISPHHDHKQTFYPSGLWRTVSEVFQIQSVAVVERYFRIVAVHPSMDSSPSREIDAATISILDDLLHEVDSDLRVNRLKVEDLERQVAAQAAKIARKESEVGSLNEEVGSLNEEVGSLNEEVGSLNEEVIRLGDQLRQRSVALENANAEILSDKTRAGERERHIATQAKKIAAMTQRVASLIDRVNSQNRRIGRLEADRAKLRDRLALAKWKLESTTSRKWWRIGVAVGQVRSNVFRIFLLPFDIVSIVFSRSALPDRPQSTMPRTLVAHDPSSVHLPSTAPEPERLEGGSDDRGDVGLVPMIVAAPPTMSLAPPLVTDITDLRVASILDEMSYESFAPECHLITFAPHNWLEVLERERPNLLLVESAWRGNAGSWEYKVGSYAYPESVGLLDLAAVIAWCRREGIPTVFWNKEDPIHFEKFKEAAALFDVVFTTDANMVGRYEELSGITDRTVGVLPFAAQPTMHNPVGAMVGRDPRPVFAGAYYRNRHQSRQEQLDMLLDAAMPFELVIYDRMGGEVTDSFGFPERFRGNIDGTLPYEQMAHTYRSHRLFLNVNSVSDSPTMFSRRVFELLASGTPVVSTSSVGVDEMFGGIVDVVSNANEAHAAISRLLEDDDWWLSRSIAGIEAVFEAHTYGDRLHTSAVAAGFDPGPVRPQVSVVLKPESEVNLHHITRFQNVAEILTFSGFRSQPEGDDVPPVRDLGPIDTEGGRALGRVAATVASSDWLAFVDSSSGMAGLNSLMTATRITPAEIYVPASSWVTGHDFVTAVDSGGLVVSSTDYVKRQSWSPWESPEVDCAGARVYSVPIVDE